MKKTGCILGMLVFFLLIGCISVNSAFAMGCEDWEVSCCIDGNDSQTVATTSFSMCWSWSKFGCVPCHGKHKWSYLATWCNDNYNQCEGKCRACHYMSSEYCRKSRTCWDKEGKSHCQ